MRYINTKYTQTADVCATASYGIIIEYFSEGKYSLLKFFNEYLSKHKLINFAEQENLRKKGRVEFNQYREDKITKHFHNHCKKKVDKRGFQYIVEFHIDNSFKTSGYCDIIKSKAQLTPIERGEVLQLREELKRGGLAMVLYPVSNNTLHSIVVGYDPTRERYFKRDPNNKEMIFEDFLLSNPITEYILFDEKDEVSRK